MGAFTHLNGDYYFGPWIESNQVGLGTEETTNLAADEKSRAEGKHRDRYEGNFVKGDKHGNGRCFYWDGQYYDGQWTKNKPHGEGTWVYADGRKYVGEWNMGIKEGQGKFIWPDGRIYEGQYVGGLKNGHGNFKIPDPEDRAALKCEYDGNWMEGKQHGRGTMTFYSKKSGDVTKTGDWDTGKHQRWI